MPAALVLPPSPLRPHAPLCLQATGDVVNVGITALQAGFELVKQAADVAKPYAQQALDVVGPVVVQGAKKASELAGPAFNAAAPAVKVRAGQHREGALWRSVAGLGTGPIATACSLASPQACAGACTHPLTYACAAAPHRRAPCRTCSRALAWT